MSNVISGKFSLSIEGVHSFGTGGSRGTRNDRIAAAIDLANAATGAYKIDRSGRDFQHSLAASGSVDYDLIGTTFLDPEGTGLSMATCRLVCIWNYNTVAGDYLLFRHKSSGGLADNTILADETHKITVQPGGCTLWFAPLFGIPVTATTADQFTVENPSSHAVLYDILTFGTST